MDNVVQLKVVDDNKRDLVGHQLPILQFVWMTGSFGLQLRTLERMENRYESKHRIYKEYCQQRDNCGYCNNQPQYSQIVSFAARFYLFL